jgi:hypothetical protein
MVRSSFQFPPDISSHLELGAVEKLGVFLFVQHGFTDQLLRAWDSRTVGCTEVGEALKVARVLRVKAE